MRLQTTQIYNVDGNFEQAVGNIILDGGVCEHEQTWKEVKSKDGEAVQHSILTTACLHKKERVWSASTVSMSTCWAKKGEFCPEERVFHNINFTAQQDQTAKGQSCWLKSH